jgi:6-phosphogluconolactonase
MRHELIVVDDLDALARVSAQLVVDRATTTVAQRRAFTMALSGGHTPWPMVQRLALRPDFPWTHTRIFQVDERVVPANDPDRNLTHLVGALPPDFDTVEVMPVDDSDLDLACRNYGRRLPDAFDLVHLGLGADGHTASLVPQDAALEVDDRLVTLTEGTYQGHRRMTLTFPALERARLLLWLVAGEDKREALRRLLAGDQTIPAGRVRAHASTVIADRAAYGEAVVGVPGAI